jgi:hypothetical protein
MKLGLKSCATSSDNLLPNSGFMNYEDGTDNLSRNVGHYSLRKSSEECKELPSTS